MQHQKKHSENTAPRFAVWPPPAEPWASKNPTHLEILDAQRALGKSQSNKWGGGTTSKDNLPGTV